MHTQTWIYAFINIWGLAIILFYLLKVLFVHLVSSVGKRVAYSGLSVACVSPCDKESKELSGHTSLLIDLAVGTQGPEFLVQMTLNPPTRAMQALPRAALHPWDWGWARWLLGKAGGVTRTWTRGLGCAHMREWEQSHGGKKASTGSW